MSFRKGVLPRGFAGKAERIAEDQRVQLGLSVFAPLDAFALAEHRGVGVYTPSELNLDERGLFVLQGWDTKEIEWGALTWRRKDRRPVIIHNCACSPARQQSNMMHELAHLILEHEHPYDDDDLLSQLPLMRHYDPVQEAEAECLGATLQVTKAALIAKLKRGHSNEEIATTYFASSQMIDFRKKQSGAEIIIRRMQQRQA